MVIINKRPVANGHNNNNNNKQPAMVIINW